MASWPLDVALDLHPGAFLEAGLGERPGGKLEHAGGARDPRGDGARRQRADGPEDLEAVVQEGDVDRIPHPDHVHLPRPLEPQPLA